jgi:hypothetical protein
MLRISCKQLKFHAIFFSYLIGGDNLSINLIGRSLCCNVIGWCAADDHEWLAPLLLMVVLALTPLWWHLARHHDVTAPVLFSGWLPVVMAMVISR